MSGDGMDMGGGGGYAWIGEMVSQGISDVSGVVQAFYEGISSDPCQGVMAGRDTMDNYETVWLDYSGYLAQAVAAIDDARASALSSWGENTTVSGVTPFIDVLWNAGARPPDLQAQTDAAIVAAFFTFGIASAIAGGDLREQWSQRLYAGLPANGQPLPGTNNGYQLGPGIWLWAGPGRTQAYHLEHGVVSGWRARELYWGWRHQTESEAEPANWPTWRTDMAYVVGSPDWRPGDPMGGYMGEFQAILAMLLQALRENEAECVVQRQLRRDLAEDTVRAGLASDVELLRQKKERDRLAALGFLVAAILISKRKKR